MNNNIDNFNNLFDNIINKLKNEQYDIIGSFYVNDFYKKYFLNFKDDFNKYYLKEDNFYNSKHIDNIISSNNEYLKNLNIYPDNLNFLSMKEYIKKSNKYDNKYDNKYNVYFLKTDDNIKDEKKNINIHDELIKYPTLSKDTLIRYHKINYINNHNYNLSNNFKLNINTFLDNINSIRKRDKIFIDFIDEVIKLKDLKQLLTFSIKYKELINNNIVAYNIYYYYQLKLLGNKKIKNTDNLSNYIKNNHDSSKPIDRRYSLNLNNSNNLSNFNNSRNSFNF